jgi:predicted dehydrogenase
MSVQELRYHARRGVNLTKRKGLRGVRLAVVGCGYWGAKHLRVVSGLPEVSEVIVVEPDARKRQNASQVFPNIAVADDLASVLDRVDGVVIATPPETHPDLGLMAIRAGKAVLIEKPLAATLALSRLLVAEAEKHRVPLMVGHTFEFNPAVIELRRRMDAGDLGDIHYIHSARLNLGLYRKDVNVVWDLAPHDISIMNFLLRATPTSVSAWVSSHASSDTSDLAYFQLNYGEQGVMGYGHVSWLDPRKVRQVTVVGSKRMAVYDDLAEEKLRIFDRGVDGGPASIGKKAPLHAMPISYRYGDIVSPHIDFQEPLMLEDRHFVECIRDRLPPRSDGASGAAVVAVLDAIDRSILAGGAVEMSPLFPQQAVPVAARA